MLPLADHDRARPTEPRDGGGVGLGDIGESRARRRGRQPRDVDVVLDRDRDPGQRQALAGGQPPPDGFGLGERLSLGPEMDPDAGSSRAGDPAVSLPDPINRGHAAPAPRLPPCPPQHSERCEQGFAARHRAEDATLHRHHLQRGRMVAGISRARAIREHEALVAEIVGFAHRRRDADVGGDPGEHQAV